MSADIDLYYNKYNNNNILNDSCWLLDIYIGNTQKRHAISLRATPTKKNMKSFLYCLDFVCVLSIYVYECQKTVFK